MTEQSIATAALQIEELMETLDNAYWEAATIESKDLIYSSIALLRTEQTEISKLSIQDHDLPYEAITKDFRELRNRLNNLQRVMEDVVMRSSTSRELSRLIPQVSALVE